MKEYERIALFISILAIIISIGTALYSGIQSEKHASSDHQAREQVKSDTADLLSTLRSLMHKGAFSTTTKEVVDIGPEKEAISKFMNSQTGLAYHALINEKSNQAEDAGKKWESWRLFFLYLAELANSDSAYAAAGRAAGVELMFDDLTESDIADIADFNADLIKAISKNSENREGNGLIKVWVEIHKKQQKEDQRFAAKLNYLKSTGIEDPNIDLFLAVIDGDVSRAEKALKAGADVHTTDTTLLQKYEEELKNFPEQ